MSKKNPQNLDPITDAPGAHPVGTGVGTTGGAIAGAALGSVVGPIGTIAGAVIEQRNSVRMRRTAIARNVSPR